MFHLFSLAFVFFVLLAVLVLTHELGHFLVACFLKVKVEEFGFGFPPRIIGIAKIKKEGKKSWMFLRKEKSFERMKKRMISPLYSFNLIPLGGFVKILGEDGENRNDPHSFASQPVWKRFAILVAGIVMNFALGAFLFTLVFWIGTPEVIKDDDSVKDAKVQVMNVAPSSPAETAGIKVGDVIRSVVSPNNERIGVEKISTVQEFSKKWAGQRVILEIMRGDDVYRMGLVPRENPPEGQGSIGMELTRVGIVKYSFLESLKRGPQRAFQLLEVMVFYLKDILGKLIQVQKVQVDVSGPVGIVVLTNQMKEMGLPYLLQFAAIISINLAFMNFLPFPALDGGRILFLVLEKIKGRPVSAKIEGTAHAIGLYLLLFLMLLITFKDFSRFGDKFAMMWERITR